MDIIVGLIIAGIVCVAVVSGELIPCLLLIIAMFFPKVGIPLLAILIVITKINDYKYQKYGNTEGDNKLYECLIGSRFLKDKPKKTTKEDKSTDKMLKIYRIILYIGVGILALTTIIAVLYSIIK